jgi:hypothetical protein
VSKTWRVFPLLLIYVAGAVTRKIIVMQTFSGGQILCCRLDATCQGVSACAWYGTCMDWWTRELSRHHQHIRINEKRAVVVY